MNKRLKKKYCFKYSVLKIRPAISEDFDECPEYIISFKSVCRLAKKLREIKNIGEENCTYSWVKIENPWMKYRNKRKSER